jgi:hypothetical protein
MRVLYFSTMAREAGEADMMGEIDCADSPKLL